MVSCVHLIKHEYKQPIEPIILYISKRSPSMKSKRKSIYEKYKHFLLLIFYMPIYLIWFAYLEKTVRTHFHVIYMKIDDYIPFCEYFIIPYLLWFLYICSL